MTRELEERLGYHFSDTALLLQAMTHKSCKKPYSNERLEYLGDAVFDLIVSEYLYRRFPKADEGELSKMRAALVNERSIVEMAVPLELGRFVQISSAEAQNKGRFKPSIIADAFEATIGAVYLDGGFDKAYRIVTMLLERAFPKLELSSISRDYKTALQEITQSRVGQTPVYELVSEAGPDHNKEFTVTVFIAGTAYATATGPSKKEAQQKAAKAALEILSKEPL
ncbi:MAG: ribonuclease III [Campylobacterales bacterium]